MIALLYSTAALLLRHAGAEAVVADQMRSVHIFSQPITTQSLLRPEPSRLASIDYNVSSLETRLLSYSPPAASNTTADTGTSHPLFSISTDAVDGSTTLTSLSTFNPSYRQTVTLHLRDGGSVFAASFSADNVTPPPPPSNPNAPATDLKVVIVQPIPGPAPKLNIRKPVMLDADGREIAQTPVAEKSFFQQYWWAFALMAVIALAGSGDK